MKRIIAILATFAMALHAAPSANAHAQMQLSYPKAGSVVRSWPDHFSVEFDGNLIQIAGSKVNQLVVQDSSGKNLKSGSTVVAGARLTVQNVKAAKSGKVTVSWRVVSDDGHPVSGSYTFLYIPKTK